MTHLKTYASLALLVVVAAGVTAIEVLDSPPPITQPQADEEQDRPGLVRCANLIYGNSKTSKCFSAEFLKDLQSQTGIPTAGQFSQVRVEAQDLYRYPFAVMSGEGAYTLTDEQREALRNYLTRGGFLVASPGCSSQPWIESFRKEIDKIFPDRKLERISMDHPIFRTVYEIKELKTSKKVHTTHLEGLSIDGKIVLIFTPEGLNDTGKAGGNCCCCGGNEIQNARHVNVNLLAYALTH